MAKFEKWREAHDIGKARSQRKPYYRRICELADGKTDNMSVPPSSSRFVETMKAKVEKLKTKTERNEKTAAPKTFLDELKKLKEVHDALSKPLVLQW